MQGGEQTWAELAQILRELRGRTPSVLVTYPDPDRDPHADPRAHTAPLRIALTADAAQTAARLHARFGDAVELTVGMLRYPPTAQAGPRHRERTPLPDLPADLQVGLDSPAVVASGRTLRHTLRLHNGSGAPVRVRTDGTVTGYVVDPASGREVGGFAGWQQQPQVDVTAPPGGSVRIPLLVGTASLDPVLGYALPPGQWAVRVPLTLAREGQDAVQFRSPALPLTVTGTHP